MNNEIIELIERKPVSLRMSSEHKSVEFLRLNFILLQVKTEFKNGIKEHKHISIKDPDNIVDQLLYKFDEYESDIDYQINNLKQSNSMPKLGRSLTKSLKDLPMQIAWDMGVMWPVICSSNKLHEDLNELMPKFMDQIKPLLYHCAKVTDLLLIDIKNEYDQWGKGRSILKTLILHARKLTLTIAKERGCEPKVEDDENDV